MERGLARPPRDAAVLPSGDWPAVRGPLVIAPGSVVVRRERFLLGAELFTIGTWRASPIAAASPSRAVAEAASMPTTEDVERDESAMPVGAPGPLAPPPPPSGGARRRKRK